jgi:hypothetical protein
VTSPEEFRQRKSSARSLNARQSGLGAARASAPLGEVRSVRSGTEFRVARLSEGVPDSAWPRRGILAGGRSGPGGIIAMVKVQGDRALAIGEADAIHRAQLHR